MTNLLCQIHLGGKCNCCLDLGPLVRRTKSSTLTARSRVCVQHPLHVALRQLRLLLVCDSCRPGKNELVCLVLRVIIKSVRLCQNEMKIALKKMNDAH